MEQLVEILKEVNIAQIFVIFVGLWAFYSRLNKKIEKLDERLSAKIDSVDARLSTKIENIDRRLCRIEGALVVQGHLF